MSGHFDHGLRVEAGVEALGRPDDLAVGVPERHGDRVATAHQDAFHERLAAVGVTGHGRSLPAARESERRTRRPAVDSRPDGGRDGDQLRTWRSRRFWKRSTWPAVSMIVCLPVKNGWQLRAHVDAELRSRGPDGPLGAARAAMDLGFVILGMDIGLHGAVLLRTPSVQGHVPRRWSPARSGLARRSPPRFPPRRPGCASCPWWRART